MMTRLTKRIQRLEETIVTRTPIEPVYLKFTPEARAEALDVLHETMNPVAWEEFMVEKGFSEGDICPHTVPAVHLGTSDVSEFDAVSHEPQPCCGRIPLTLVEMDGQLLKATAATTE